MLKKYSENSNKYILYLDSRGLPCERQRELLVALEQGYNIVMATPTPDAYKGYQLSHIIDVEVGDYKTAKPSIISYLTKAKLNISGIVAWKDREVELAALLGKELSLPCSELDAAINVRNKALTRKVLEGIADCNPRYGEVRNKEEFIKVLEHVGVPALLKPCGNSGSRGIQRITSHETAIEEYEEFLTYNSSQGDEMFHYYSGTALLEEVLVGSEHSVAGIVAGEAVVVLGVADKKFLPRTCFQYQNTIPSALPAEQITEVVSLIKQAVAATGIKNCGFHADFMVTETGIKILEVGGRLGGELINSHLIPIAQPGLDPYEAILEVIQGRNPFLADDYTGTFSSKAGSRVILSPDLGKISAVKGVETVRKDSRCREFMQTYGVGDEMVPPKVRFKSCEIGYVVAQCDMSEDIDRVLDELSDRITIELYNL